jgi:hypothetical protein
MALQESGCPMLTVWTAASLAGGKSTSLATFGSWSSCFSLLSFPALSIGVGGSSARTGDARSAEANVSFLMTLRRRKPRLASHRTSSRRSPVTNRDVSAQNAGNHFLWQINSAEAAVTQRKNPPEVLFQLFNALVRHHLSFGLRHQEQRSNLTGPPQDLACSDEALRVRGGTEGDVTPRRAARATVPDSNRFRSERGAASAAAFRPRSILPA